MQYISLCLKDGTCQYWGLRNNGMIIASIMTAIAIDNEQFIIIDNLCRLQDDKYKGSGRILLTLLIDLIKKDKSIKNIQLTAHGDILATYYKSFGFIVMDNDNLMLKL